MKEFGYFEGDPAKIHLMSVRIGGGEYTVCGLAYDIGGPEEEKSWLGDFITTNKRTVTCPGCIVEIKNCRGVKCAS